MNQTIDDGESAPDRPSRTRKKKEAIALQKLGEQLVSLKAAQLDSLALPAELHEAVTEARAMTSHGARRRQFQYIGSLMRQVDAASIQAHLDRIAAHAHGEVRQFRQVEQWRDELAAGVNDRFEWLVGHYPGIEPEELLQLVQAVRRNTSAPEQRKAGRALFRYLRRITERDAS